MHYNWKAKAMTCLSCSFIRFYIWLHQVDHVIFKILFSCCCFFQSVSGKHMADCCRAGEAGETHSVRSHPQHCVPFHRALSELVRPERPEPHLRACQNARWDFTEIFCSAEQWRHLHIYTAALCKHCMDKKIFIKTKGMQSRQNVTGLARSSLSAVHYDWISCIIFYLND